MNRKDLTMKVALFFLCAFGVMAQNDSGTRELFFFKKSQPAVSSTNTNVPVPFGIRYSILQRNRAGRLVEVDASAVFRHGDSIRLQFTANQDGYLYVGHQGSSGQWSLLFPSSATEVYTLKEMLALAVPQNDEIVFDSQPGTERLFVIASRVPVPSLENLIPGRKSSTGKDSMPTPEKLNPNGTRDLRVQRVGARPDRSNAEFATYVVNTSKASPDRITTEIRLQHK